MQKNKRLQDALRDLVSIVEIHTNATGNNFAWAELDEARSALTEQEIEMSEHKHTAGPWTDGRSIPITAKSCEENGFSFVYVNSDDKTEPEANARLIAAAPDLLAALEKSREDINWMLNSGQSLNGHVFDYIDGAIAKATGATKE